MAECTPKSPESGVFDCYQPPTLAKAALMNKNNIAIHLCQREKKNLFFTGKEILQIYHIPEKKSLGFPSFLVDSDSLKKEIPECFVQA